MSHSGSASGHETKEGDGLLNKEELFQALIEWDIQSEVCATLW